jgi:hypothetical protein
MIKAGGEYEKCLFIKFMKKTIHGNQQLWRIHIREFKNSTRWAENSWTAYLKPLEYNFCSSK